MSFKEAIVTCMNKKYATLDGRATRSEYWYFALFTFLISFIAAFVGGFISELVSLCCVALVSAIFLIPSIAVTVRRLHDLNASGWLTLLLIIPLLNLGLVIFLMLPSKLEENKYGKVN